MRAGSLPAPPGARGEVRRRCHRSTPASRATKLVRPTTPSVPRDTLSLSHATGCRRHPTRSWMAWVVHVHRGPLHRLPQRGRRDSRLVPCDLDLRCHDAPCVHRASGTTPAARAITTVFMGATTLCPGHDHRYSIEPRPHSVDILMIGTEPPTPDSRPRDHGARSRSLRARLRKTGLPQAHPATHPGRPASTHR